MDIVTDGSYHKFAHSITPRRDADSDTNGGGGDLGGEQMDMKKMFLATGDRELVEASPVDRIWGVGFEEREAGERRVEWGMNLLGKALMAARERIRLDETKKQHEEGV